MSLSKLARKVLHLPEKYDENDFRRREEWRGEYAILAQAVLGNFDFETAYDVGCANGFLLSELLRAGKTVAGIEYSADVRKVLPDSLHPLVEVGDFSKGSGRWDLVSCVEVAEHIHRERSEDLVETLTRLAKRWIYFTAAPPGQGGHGHINCRPRQDWLEMFAARGWREDQQRTAAVQKDLERLDRAWWLRTNTIALAPVSR